MITAPEAVMLAERAPSCEKCGADKGLAPSYSTI
jgi:hypothetical protein